jgi:hypothetical protein
MNGSGILIEMFDSYKEYFDNIFVCDGDLRGGSNYPDYATVFDMPWDDKYIDRYRKTAAATDTGDWVLHLDDDELPSPELLDFLKNRQFDGDMYMLPCVLHVDNKPVEPWPNKEYTGQWTKNILYKKTEDLSFRFFGSHVIPLQKNRKYIPYPYFHMKSLSSFVMNDCLQAFVLPQGQGYDPIESKQFGILTSVYKNSLEFRESIEKGTWSPALIKFAWSKRHEFKRPISRLSWAYHLLNNHKMPFDDNFMKWENVSKYIL